MPRKQAKPGPIMRAIGAIKGKAVRKVQAGFDSAYTNEATRKHWAAADELSADSAASPDIRRQLRMRARYETKNNSYARGIVCTLANDTIGTGPRLQMLLKDDAANREIEDKFGQWSRAINLADKLKIMRQALSESGEVFGVMTNNRELQAPISLDMKLIEADQVETPAMGIMPNDVDGIEFDSFGNPAFYHILKDHPGHTNGTTISFPNDFDRVRASSVIHYFRADRPGQSRGIPELTPALPLFAQLRRYTLAVIGAAETAADFAGVLYTDAPASGENDEFDPMSTVELEPRALVSMPAGWKLGQIKSEQPTTTYKDFKDAILNEIARSLNMPFNVAAGNSSGYNFASGKLDHQVYFKAIAVEQDRIGRLILDRLFAEFLREASLREGVLKVRTRSRIPGDRLPNHQWFFDGQSEVDPVKEANAQGTRLANMTSTLAREYAKQGLDWQSQLAQVARERQEMERLGLTIQEANPALLPEGAEEDVE